MTPGRYAIRFIAALLSLHVIGCTGDRPNHTAVGAGTGAVLGAGLGAILGDQVGNTGEGIAIGAGAGALIGSALGYGSETSTQKAEEQDERLRRQQEELERQRRELEEMRRGGRYQDDGYRRAPPPSEWRRDDSRRPDNGDTRPRDDDFRYNDPARGDDRRY